MQRSLTLFEMQVPEWTKVLIIFLLHRTGERNTSIPTTLEFLLTTSWSRYKQTFIHLVDAVWVEWERSFHHGCTVNPNVLKKGLYSLAYRPDLWEKDRFDKVDVIRRAQMQNQWLFYRQASVP